ncbi:hypothetical protein LCGC14_1936360 [marine sediment metagenome]|uniref:Uncharacterized protein n=1 Tax=marine sediment metagenome TaxID=412755 RepID=A0A0F9GA10_9ZZZZ
MTRKAVKIDYSKLRVKAAEIAQNTPTKNEYRRPTEQRVVGKETKN